MYKRVKAKPKEKRAQKEASEPNHMGAKCHARQQIRCLGERAQGKKVAGAKGPSNKDRTNICRVCMLSNCTFVTKTSVVSDYVGLTSLYESLWPDSLSTRRGKPRVVAYATGF